MTLGAALREALQEHGPLVFFGAGVADELPSTLERVHCPPQTVLAAAAGAAVARAGRPVVAVAGDGDIYGAQMGDLIHLCRRNPPLTVIVADNGFLTTRETVVAPYEYPIRPQELALAAGSSFVAQGWVGDRIHLARLLAEAIGHPGFSLVNVFMRGGDFYGKQEVNLDGQVGYDRRNRQAAVQRALDAAGFYTGILYHNPDRAPMPGMHLRGPLEAGEWQEAVAGTMIDS